MKSAILLLAAMFCLTSCENNDERSAISMTSETATIESGDNMKNNIFSALTNVELINADLGSMTDADIDTLRVLVSEDMTYTHMSGMTQTREEYFADIADAACGTSRSVWTARKSRSAAIMQPSHIPRC